LLSSSFNIPSIFVLFFLFFQAEDGIRDRNVTGVQTCALPIFVVPVLLIFGAIFKNTPKLTDWLIPYMLLPLGIVFTIALLEFSTHAIIQGILVTGVAVFSNQLYKQYCKRKR